MNDPDFEIISVAQDSQGEPAAGPWFDRASPTFHSVIDPTHKISSLFGWVNVPSAAWIDEEGRIVRINEGGYAAAHHIDKFIISVKFGSTAFGDAVKDWVRQGSNSPFVWSAREVRARLKADTIESRSAEAFFKMGLYFSGQGDDRKADHYFGRAQTLSPHNWNYHRQAWTRKGELYATRQWRKKTVRMTETDPDRYYYAPLELPGAPDVRVTRMEFIWTRWINFLKGLFSRTPDQPDRIR
ncbi:MAG: hypothetical protein MI863_28500 [Desulfobacterales bacterium]|nr:hypothetical protein [Desulfobacterales bacterium]